MDKEVIKDLSDNLEMMDKVLKNSGAFVSVCEDVMKDYKKSNARSFVIIIALLLALFLTNAYWIWNFTQYDFLTIDDNSFNNNILRDINEMRDINNGDTGKIQERQQPEDSDAESGEAPPVE